MSEFPEPVPLEVSPVQKASSWRDNKNTLWLVRIGFALQFYIPAIVCVYLILANSIPQPIPDPSDELLYSEYQTSEIIRDILRIGSICTLVLLFVQCTIFSIVLRLPKLRFAANVLWWLVAINVIHSMIWLCFGIPITLGRLILPTILYIVAIFVEHNTPSSNDSSTQADTP